MTGKAEQKNGLSWKPGRAAAIVTVWRTHRRAASRKTHAFPRTWVPTHRPDGKSGSATSSSSNQPPTS